MTGLGLQRFQRHAVLTQPGQARVAQLVTRPVGQPCPGASYGDDLVEAVGRQRPAPVLPLQHDEHPIRRSTRRPLGIHVGRNGREERRRQRDQPLMAALAVSDEHPPLTQPEILEAQPEHFAATQPAQHHRLHHRPIPCGAQRRHQRGHLDRLQDARQATHRTHQRLPAPITTTPPRRQTARHRVRLHPGITAGDQIAVERRHRSQPPTDRRYRQPRPAVGDPRHVLRASPSPLLSCDEPEHILRPHIDRVLPDHSEERLQVVGIRAHRVRPRPTGGEPQKVIDQPMTEKEHLTLIAAPCNTTNLRQPDHGKPPRSSSARRRLPGRSAQLVDHPYKCR
jgi:hypothetical protein